MWIDTNNARLQLRRDQALRLQHARGTRLRAVHGTLWVTIDNDPRDIVLDPGQAYVVDSQAPVVALPLGDRATLDVCAARAPAAAVLALPTHWLRALRARLHVRGAVVAG